MRKQATVEVINIDAQVLEPAMNTVWCVYDDEKVKLLGACGVRKDSRD